MILREDDDGNTLDHLESYGLVDDCSIFEGLQYYARYLGGSVQASLKALDEGFRYVINWDGGRHHAQASLASGFCFINGTIFEAIIIYIFRCRIVDFKSCDRL